MIVGVGPWVKQIWDMLQLPEAITVKGRDGKLYHDRQMWTFWSLQEGTLGVDPKLQRTNAGDMPPVIHVDTDAPLYSDIDGSLNLAGVRNPAADAMIEAMLQADTEEDFTAAVRAFDRVLISGDYAIPLFYLPKVWVAYRSTLKFPATLPLGGFDVDTWWFGRR